MVRKKGRKKGEPYARLSHADTIKTTLICAAQSVSFYSFDAFSRIVREMVDGIFGKRGKVRELTEVGIKDVENGKKRGRREEKRERERVYVCIDD